MRQIKSFELTGGGPSKAIGQVIEEHVNPFLADHENAEIESINIEMAGSFHKAIVVVGYDVDKKISKK